VAYGIPGEIIDQVRENADIVEIVAEHVVLKQSGRNYKALCPFHHEKTPSFIVSPEKQIYHCFGCGAGGNVFNFLMQVENISFPEAVRLLARRYGIAIPEPSRRDSVASLGYRINAVAAKLYRRILLGTKEGGRVRRYLRERKVDEATEEEFLLGYAPSEANVLLQEAKRKKIDQKKLLELGLAIEKEGDVRDLFRKRLIFPIATAGGRVVGFGGRVVDDGQPKYLNSPETRLFKKSESLYGIYRAKTEMRRQGRAVVVEGYMDVIPLHAHGFKHTVASLGTAFTFEQARRLRNYCGEVTFLYDGDQAGKLVALRACAPALRAGLKVTIATLPEGDDPDSFIRLQGEQALAAVLDTALHYIDFGFEQLSNEDPEDVIKFMLRMLGEISDPVRRSLDLKHLAERSGLAETTLEQALRRIGTGPKVQQTAPKVGDIPCDKIEKSIVSILIGLPECADKVFAVISPSDFADRRMRQIAEVIFQRKSKGLDFGVSALLSEIDDEPTRRLLTEATLGVELAGDITRIVNDHIVCMRRRKITREIEKLRARIIAAEKEGDARELQDLLSRRQNLAEELKLLST